MTIEKTLEERGSRYGVFAEQAAIAVRLKRDMRSGVNWSKMEPDQKEALDLIANKISRILNGDPNYHDNWHDIIGYAKLVADRIQARDQTWADAAAAETAVLGEGPGCPMTVKVVGDLAGPMGRSDNWIKPRVPETEKIGNDSPLRRHCVPSVDGWLAFDGKDCPVAGDVIVSIRTRHMQLGPLPASLFNWDKHVQAYRIAE